MDSIKSFKGYGKVDEAEERAFRRKSRKRFMIIIISIILLAVIVVGAVAATLIHRKNRDSDRNSSSSSADSIKAICSVTLYKDSCSSSLESIESSGKSDPEDLFKLTLQIAMNALSNLSSVPDSLKARANDAGVKAALEDCKGLFEDSISQINDSLSLMQPGNGEKLLSDSKIDDLRTWLSSAVTNQETCLDGLAEFSVEYRRLMQDAMKNSTEFTSNCLAIATKILSILQKLDIPIHRKLLAVDFPIWVSGKDRKLFQGSTNPTPNVIVDANGSGDFKTIGEALKTVPKKSKTRYVIYVKEGTYKEKVVIEKSMWNVMVYGDGQAKTIVSGSLNKKAGTPTFDTPCFVALGRNFIAKDMGFENTAGPEGEQAVALRSGSDCSAFYRCSFTGYQDTLYAHSNRQFYSECNITGTVDFIFGNSEVVFQGCNILPREPGSGQKNTITAQGKSDPNQNTGISIQGCKISELSGTLKAQTYLGRPWKTYSTTVVMQTAIGNFLHPAGWLSWTGDNTEPPSTIFYAEYMNTGPGSNVANRVKWAGYKSSITEDVAKKYTVDSFIQGSEWLPATGVNYGASL